MRQCQAERRRWRTSRRRSRAVYPPHTPIFSRDDDRLLEAGLPHAALRADGLGLLARILVVLGMEDLRVRALAAADFPPARDGRRCHASQSARPWGELRVRHEGCQMSGKERRRIRPTGQNGGGGESAGWPRPGPRGTRPRNVRTPQGRVLGNTQSGRLAGKCHREQTADGGSFGTAQVRVKRCGKSAPAPGVTPVARQTPSGARPSRGMGCPLRYDPRVGRKSGRVTVRREGWPSPDRKIGDRIRRTGRLATNTSRPA